MFAVAATHPAPLEATYRQQSWRLSSVLGNDRRFRAPLLWVAVYAVVTQLTGAFFMADTVDYATDVFHLYRGLHHTFWEFGHLFWRPLGWVLLRALTPLIQRFTHADAWVQETHILIALNWLAGLACVFLLRACLRRFPVRPATADLCTLAFLFSNGFLNYIHSGSSYIPGLAFLLLGLYWLAARAEVETPSAWRPVAAAAALALAVFLWFPYIFALPGILAMPLIYRSDSQSRRALTSLALRTTIYCLIMGVVSYALVLARLRLFSFADIFRWVTEEATAIGGVHGTTRAIFGLARSFINMGDDGVLFKRFLLHDPYNPVSFFELSRASLLKLVLYYSLLAAVLKQLLDSGNRRIFWLSLAVATPVFAFALFWYGGDVERYMALYPVFFIAVSCALTSDRAPAYLKWLATIVLLVGVYSNFAATSNFTLRKEQRQVQERVKDILPLLNSSSRVILLDINDEIQNFKRTFLFQPIVRHDMISTYTVLNVGTPKDFRWHQDLAQIVSKTWGAGGDVWVSKRVLEERPQRNWNWVEGASPHVTWPMVRSFFTEFDYGRSVGGEDGFVFLPPTEKNRAIIDTLQIADAAAKQQLSDRRIWIGSAASVRNSKWLSPTEDFRGIM
jgi:hypothetical protein